MTTNQVFEDVKKHLESSPKNRIAIVKFGGRKLSVYEPKHLPMISAEGSGLRIGKVFVFAGSIKFAHVA